MKNSEDELESAVSSS